jgi:hypothetical protein
MNELAYLFSDHLGSTSAAANPDGTNLRSQAMRLCVSLSCPKRRERKPSSRILSGNENSPHGDCAFVSVQDGRRHARHLPRSARRGQPE